MPWTDEDQAAAELTIVAALNHRELEREIDDDPRVIAAMAPENVGNRRHPQGPTLTGDRLRRRLFSGRYDRWATVVWRATLAAQVGRSQARRARWAAGVPLNRAQRRAAARKARR